MDKKWVTPKNPAARPVERFTVSKDMYFRKLGEIQDLKDEIERLKNLLAQKTPDESGVFRDA